MIACGTTPSPTRTAGIQSPNRTPPHSPARGSVPGRAGPQAAAVAAAARVMRHATDSGLHHRCNVEPLGTPPPQLSATAKQAQRGPHHEPPNGYGATCGLAGVDGALPPTSPSRRALQPRLVFGPALWDADSGAEGDCTEELMLVYCADAHGLCSGPLGAETEQDDELETRRGSCKGILQRGAGGGAAAGAVKRRPSQSLERCFAILH